MKRRPLLIQQTSACLLFIAIVFGILKFVILCSLAGLLAGIVFFFDEKTELFFGSARRIDESIRELAATERTFEGFVKLVLVAISLLALVSAIGVWTDYFELKSGPIVDLSVAAAIPTIAMFFLQSVPNFLGHSEDADRKTIAKWATLAMLSLGVSLVSFTVVIIDNVRLKHDRVERVRVMDDIDDYFKSNMTDYAYVHRRLDSVLQHDAGDWRVHDQKGIAFYRQAKLAIEKREGPTETLFESAIASADAAIRNTQEDHEERCAAMANKALYHKAFGDYYGQVGLAGKQAEQHKLAKKSFADLRELNRNFRLDPTLALEEAELRGESEATVLRLYAITAAILARNAKYPEQPERHWEVDVKKLALPLLNDGQKLIEAVHWW